MISTKLRLAMEDKMDEFFEEHGGEQGDAYLGPMTGTLMATAALAVLEAIQDAQDAGIADGSLEQK